MYKGGDDGIQTAGDRSGIFWDDKSGVEFKGSGWEDEREVSGSGGGVDKEGLCFVVRDAEGVWGD
ncbi:MAG: hypothetical protein WC614_08320 [bacterium]